MHRLVSMTKMMLRQRISISKECDARPLEATRGRKAAAAAAAADLLRGAFSGENSLPDLVDREFLHGVHDVVEIEPGTAPTQPDDWDHLPAHERLHVPFTDAEFSGDILKIGEVIAVVRQSALGDHRHGLGNGRLGVVRRVELFVEFHVFLLLFSGG